MRYLAPCVGVLQDLPDFFPSRHSAMTTETDRPVIIDFDNPTDEEKAWILARLEEAEHSTKPRIAHEQVMARQWADIERLVKKQA